MVQREIEVKAPIETMFSVIRDFASYPEFLSTTHSAKERKTKSGIVVDFSIDVVKTIHYTLKFQMEEPTRLSWELVKGDLMKKNAGSWELTSLGPKKTKALYSIDVDFGWLVPKMIIDQVTKTQLPDTLKAFKERAEGLAANRSASG